MVETKEITLLYLSTHIGAIIEATKKFQLLQFELLDALMRGSSSGSGWGNSTVSPTTNADTEDNGDFSNSIASSSNETPSFQPSEVLTYVVLISTFRPKELLGFLATHDNYPLDETLQLARNKNIFDAIIFLLERTGDTMSAIELCITEISQIMITFYKEIDIMVKNQLSYNNKNITSTTTNVPIDILQILNKTTNDYNSTTMKIINSLEIFITFQNCIQIASNICIKSNDTSIWFKVLEHLLQEKCNIIIIYCTSIILHSIVLSTVCYL
jgi:hypothetical protein